MTVCLSSQGDADGEIRERLRYGDLCFGGAIPYLSYLLRDRDKGHLVDEAHYKRIYRKAGRLSPVVLVNGRAVGIWPRDRRGERLSLRVEPFHGMSQAVREGIEIEARDLGRFLGATCEIAYASPDR